MTVEAQERWLRRSAVLALIALALIVWSLAVPEPVPVIVSMTLGQVVGTASFGIYLVIVAVDLGLARRLRRSATAAQTAKGASELSEKKEESAKGEISEQPSVPAKEASESAESETADAESADAESAEQDAESARASAEDES